MAQKNETLTLVLSLIVTLGILSSGLWWLLQVREDTTGSTTTNPENATVSEGFPTTEKTFNAVETVPSGLFKYGGSSQWTPIRESIDPIIKQTYPEFRLRHQNPATENLSSEAAIARLLSDQFAFALSSRPLREGESEAAQARGYALQAIPVAIDGIAIAVNPALEIPGLTIAQLQAIYTGRIRNWQAVGGTNLAIIPYSSAKYASWTVFSQQVLQEENLGATVQLLDSSSASLRTVAQTPGAIYYGAASKIVPNCGVKPLPLGSQPDQWLPPYEPPLVSEMACRQQGQRNRPNFKAFQTQNYPLTQRLFVVVKEAGNLDQQAGEAYAKLLLTEQGQDLIRSSGFVNIR